MYTLHCDDGIVGVCTTMTTTSPSGTSQQWATMQVSRWMDIDHHQHNTHQCPPPPHHCNTHTSSHIISSSYSSSSSSNIISGRFYKYAMQDVLAYQLSTHSALQQEVQQVEALVLEILRTNPFPVPNSNPDVTRILTEFTNNQVGRWMCVGVCG